MKEQTEPCILKDSCTNLICIHRLPHTYSISCEEFCKLRTYQCSDYLNKGGEKDDKKY